MGDTKLCLLLLLSTYAFAQQGNDSANDQTPTCLLAGRFKNFKKYVYRYEAESQNGVTGTANLRNGPKVTCKVEVEVPQTCSFTLRTTECTLSEVKLINPQGQLVYSQAPSAVAFKAAMERNMLKFTIEGESSVSLFPEMDEPTNILNIKRGIISALMAPAEEEQSNRYMHTLHGVCQSEVTVNSKGEPATDVTVTRDLQDCDHFDPQRDYTSPLALISGMNMPLSTLISSSQSCNYQFDPKRRHVTEATCIEKHIFLPFSHNAEYGISSLVKQTLTLQESSKINNRYFDHDESTLKSLFMEHAQDKSPVQTKEAVLTALRDLVNLPKTQQGQQRAGLFQKLVTELRALRNETLGLMIEEMNTLSSIITSQALVQCGTPECTSAILQVLRTSKSPAFQTDLVVYALGLLPSPCNRRVRDLLSMAQNKQTRGTFYALSNSVKKFYQNEGKVTPEITDVADFMAFMLGSDCSGDQDSAYLTLRAIGNMGGAMEAASPKLKSTMLKCVRQQATSLAVQQAAIQAFRQMTITDEVRSILLQTFQDGSAPVQKRVAAYLMLMKNPTLFELGKVSRALVKEKNEQVKSFVASHIANILDSKDASVQQLKDMILEALKGNEVPAAQDFKTFSRNYQMSSSMPSQGDPLSTTMKGNMIFDPSGYMPREVMLETTLKAFGYNIDMFEVGLDGKGFEPSIDSLFGEKGFFPDSAMKVMYWAENKMPDKINDILKQFTPLKNERAKRELPEDIMKELSRNFNKLVKDLKSQTSPEAVAYLRILGMELGYLKTSDVKYIGEMAMALSSSLAAIPGKIAKSLLSSTDNEIFAHYIFMDNEFSLPTSTGFPLKFSLSGIFAPGATGGLERSSDLVFRPSMGIEFVTHMGVHIPEFTTAGIEMHTTVYHESGLKATLTMKNNQVKLSIPAPQGPTQLFSVSNKLLSVSSTQTEIVPPMVESRTDSVTCKPLITGLQFCSIVRYSNASSTDAAPYYPLTGETRFALEIQPTGEVTEYSATIGYELVKEGRHKVDTVKIALNTEGTEGTEATATLKYNRNRNAVSSDFKIPDYDVEAGVKLGATADGMYKGKKTYILSLDVTNKNIPELTLVGRARLEGMKDGLLQVQMTVPSLKIDASTTATIKSSSGLTVQLDSSVKIPESSSLQRVIFRYDDDKAEIELKSDVNSELTKLLPSPESYQKYLQRYIDDILDQKVAKTDMKLRHIVSKSIEASNIWLDKVAKDFPYVETFRSKRNIPELTLPSLPERLYLKSDSLFRYQFNKDKFIINIPLPFGGQSSEDLNIPNVMYTPPLYLPKMNINIPTKELTIPSFTIPPTYELSLPLLGVAELSTRLSSNYYNWTASVSGGNQTQDVFNYAAQYQVTAEGPVDFLSYKIEGTGLLTGLFEDTWKGIVNGSLHHQLLDASFSYSESGTRKEKINARANSNFDASSVLGLKATMFYSSHLIGTSDLLTTDSSLEGRISLGQLYSTCSYTTTYEIDLVKLQGKGESTLNLDSSLFQATNRLKGSYSNEELSITSSTDALNHALKHIGEVNYKNGQFSLKSDTTARSPYKTLTNKVELLLSSQAATVRAESQVQYLQNKVSAVVSGSLNDRGLEINTDGSINMEVSCGFHKGTLSINREGLLTSSTTNFKCTPVKFENVFNGGIDASGAAFKLKSNGDILQNKAELSVEGKVGLSEAFLNTLYNGNLMDVNTRNNFNLKVNKRGLTYISNMMGSYKKMKTDNTHKLTITLWTLSFQSKTDNYICPQASYKHDVKLDMKPFIASLSLNNDLRLLDADVTNEGQFKLEPYKMNLMGNIRGTYGPKKEVRHNYEISYSDLKGIVKCSTTGNIEGSQMSHNFDLEVAGLSAKFNSEGRINSKSLKADSKILTLAMPFSLSVDAIINADGKLNLYENHNGQLYSKFLLKAEPLALTYSHDCRASTAHGTSVSTLLENKVDALLVPSEQKGTWKLKTKFNKNVYNHDILAFNSAEQIGVELSGQLLTDLFNKLSSPARSSRDVSSQVQDFTISGFLKYDKNKDIHVIHLPFVESLPALIEQTKYAFVTALESLQEYLKSLNINDVIRKYKASLDKLPQQVNDYIKKMDLENKVSEAKKKLIAFTEEYTVTLEDLEAVLEQLQESYQKAHIEMQNQLNSLLNNIRNAYDEAKLREFIEDILRQIVNQIKFIDKKYEITRTAVNTISAMEDIIKKYDLKKIKESGAAWLQNLDAKYEIKAELQRKLNELKKLIQSLDLQKIADDLKEQIQAINLEESLSKLKVNIPTEEITKILDAIKDVLLNWIEEYEVTEKINVAYLKLKELIVKYEVDKKLQVLMDKAVQLSKQYKVKETVQSAVNALKRIDVKTYTDKAQKYLDDTIKQLKAVDYKKLIDHLNECIDWLLKELKSFDYNTFVDDANKRISEMTKYVNDQIKTLEIPQKIEALREYVREIQNAAVAYLEKLKDTKVAEVIAWIRDFVDTTALNEIGKVVEDNLMDLKQRISTMDIRREIQIYLQRASDFYINMVNYITEQWNKAYQEISNLAEKYDRIRTANILRVTIEQGFVFPEIRIATLRIPSFELSLRALKKAEFETPEFTVPFTDLFIPSTKINLKKLQDISIPARFTTPAVKILNTYTIPSITIDFNEIRKGIISVVDRVRDFKIQLPEPKIYFRDLKVAYLSDLPDFTLPEITLSEISIPEFSIPKLDLTNFQITMLQIPEFQLPRIPHEVSVPTFGKLYGEFKIKSPYYNLITSAEIQNATTTQETPTFTASVTSQATSTLECLAYTLDATAQISAPKMRSLVLAETIKVNHIAFSLDHESSLSFLGAEVLGTARTTAKATTEVYTADLVNTIRVSLQSGVSATMSTTYNHNLNIPAADISCQAALLQNINTRLESGTVSVTIGNTGNGKWSIQEYVDEGRHKSDLEFNININTAKLTFAGETSSKVLKMKQSAKVEAVIFSHVTLDMSAQTETPFLRTSVLEVKGKAHLADMKIELIANHDAELTGRISGTLTHSLNFLVHPFEVVFNTNNKGNMKIAFPLKLTGKIDLLNNYALTLNYGVQQVGWQSLARFNQYKYIHNFTLGNNEKDIGVYAAMNGEANLDFLNVPITIPAMQMPYTSVKTPSVKDLSLWERTGLKSLLGTTRQSFDLSFKVQYQKNPEMHSFSINLEPVYKTINDNVKVLNENFVYGRDQAFILLTDSYNTAKEQYDRFKIDTSVSKVPRTFRIPGYTVPVLNIEVSPFTAELPAFSFLIPREVSTPSLRVPMVGFSIPSYTLVLPSLELPLLHVPSTLRKLTLPKFKLPNIQNTINIPALGNLTYDFAFKSTVITLNANAGLYNQADIVARFGASSTSVFEVLKFKLDGTTSLTRKRGLKLATALSLDHVNVGGSHDSTVSLTKKNMEASVSTNAKVNLPIVSVDFSQELLGNSKSKPNVASKIKLEYNFDVPQIPTKGKGSVEQNLALEGLTSYFSLEASTKGKIDGTMMQTHKFTGTINNEANVYLNANGLRSTMKTDANSKVDTKKTKVWNFEMNENVALEASPRRIYAMWNYTSNNEAIAKSFNTKGKQVAKATLDLVPSMLLADFQIDISQPSSFAEEASIFETLTLSVNSDKQKFTWSGKEQITSKILAYDLLLSNDELEVRFDVSGSVQGHVSFLKDVTIPVYEKSLWDVLKFDVTTSEEKLQFLKSSTSIVYTKNKDGYFFPLPVKALEDGFTINIPEITLEVPKWVKDLPQTIQEIDIPTDNFQFPDIISIPSVITTPAFKVPLTSLQVPSYQINFNELEIPKKIRTLPFELTLPHLPKVKFPKLNVGAEYLDNVKSKLPHFVVSVPEFDITISSFTLPKTFTIGTKEIHLDNIVNQISNFDLPTITIPEQKIEIPDLSVHLPAGVFIPLFGALSATVKVESPVYNVSWTTSLENKSPSFISSVKSSCSSTMMFLEYDLEASTTTTYQDGDFDLNGKCTISHKDFSLNEQHQYTLHGHRMKRQSTPDAGASRQSLIVDITSPTFVDVSVRYVAVKDSITASLSSPSAGFLGFLLERDAPEGVHTSLYCRYPSSPDKDVNILDAKMNLKNPQNLHIEGDWDAQVSYDILAGLKRRVPRIMSAVYQCINKYHREHFGMDINRATRKMKNAISDTIETSYRDFPLKISQLQSEFEQLNDKTRKMYKRVADSLGSVDLQQIRSKFYDRTKDVIRQYQKKIKDLLDAAIKFLRETKFQLPGYEERFTGHQIYMKATQSVMMYIDQIMQKVDQYLEECTDALLDYIKKLEFKVPGTDQTVSGKKLLDDLKIVLRKVQDKVREIVKSLQKISLEKMLQEFKDFLQTCSQKAEEVITALKSQNLEEMKTRVQGMYSDAINSPTAEKINEALKQIQQTVAVVHGWTKEMLNLIMKNLEKASLYIKSLREEYLDTNMVGWTVKYYEIEEKIIELAKAFVVYMQNIQMVVGSKGEEFFSYAKDLVVDAEGRGRQISDVINRVQEKISEWSVDAKRSAGAHVDLVKRRILEAYDQMSLDNVTSALEKIIQYITDAYMSVYRETLSFIQELSKKVKPYVQVSEGKFKIDFPLPSGFP